MPEIQDKRERVVVPNGRPLHDYVNLYFNGRNKMMYKRRHHHQDLCVLRVDKTVLNLPDVVIATQNASSSHVRFAGAPYGVGLIDRNYVFAQSWTHPGDPIEEMRHGSAVCAEVLVPDMVAPDLIIGCHVSCQKAADLCSTVAPQLPVALNRNLFFQ